MDLFHFSSKGERKGSPKDDPLSSKSGNSSKGFLKTSIKTANALVTLSIHYESPPLVFHGDTNNSTGAILSGQLKVTVNRPELKLETLGMELLAIITTKKPSCTRCLDCRAVTTKIHFWKFLSKPSSLGTGEHLFPFSCHLPGYLPSTSNGSLGSIEYSLNANATGSGFEAPKTTRMLTIRRALEPEANRINHQSVGPCHVWIKLIYPDVIHPIGSFSFQVYLTGVVVRKKDHYIRFVVQKLKWRAEEHFIIISPACRKHTPKSGIITQKGVYHRDTAVIGEGCIASGWKNDFTIPKGQVDFEFGVALKPNSRYVCDVKSTTGLEVKHTFFLEIVVAEYYIMDSNPRHAIPSGHMYVLRTTSKLILTDRGGMGISWDKEQPPIYKDVPHGPPGYIETGIDTGKNLDRTS